MISTETLASNHEMLRQYLGGVRFTALADNYLFSLRTQTPCPAHVCPLAEYASNSGEYAPEVAELAALEQAQREAFEAPDAPTVTEREVAAQDLAASEVWKLRLHPGLRLLRFHHNTTSIWSALRCGEMPPWPKALSSPQDIMVWRQKNQARMRILGPEEYQAICLARPNKPVAAESMAPYLRCWLEAGILSEVRGMSCVK